MTIREKRIEELKKRGFTGSQIGLRQHMMGCICGEIGEIFICQGEFWAGHFCLNVGGWTSKKLPSIPKKDLLELYDKLHYIGVGEP